MALTKTTTLASISILDTNELECKFHEIVKDGDDVLSTKVHFEVLQVGASLTGKDPKVQAAAAAAWTPELMAAKTAEIVAQAEQETAERNAAKAAADAARIAAEGAAPVAPAAVLSVSPRQIRMALSQAGLRAGVEAAVAAGPQSLKDWYEFSTTFEESNPEVQAMAAALGVSESELHDLFALAASL